MYVSVLDYGGMGCLEANGANGMQQVANIVAIPDRQSQYISSHAFSLCKSCLGKLSPECAYTTYVLLAHVMFCFSPVCAPHGPNRLCDFAFVTPYSLRHSGQK
jgi:hypothetical protein